MAGCQAVRDIKYHGANVAEMIPQFGIVLKFASRIRRAPWMRDSRVMTNRNGAVRLESVDMSESVLVSSAMAGKELDISRSLLSGTCPELALWRSRIFSRIITRELPNQGLDLGRNHALR